MIVRRSNTRVLLSTLLAATLLVGCQDRAETPSEPQLHLGSGHRGGPVGGIEVFTQNVFLGGDTGPLFTLDFTDIPAVLAATNVFWAEVQASAGAERVAEIAAEIEARKPHLVGLQEMLRFVTLDGAFQPTGGLDLLAALEAEIAARGLPYETQVVQETTSSVLPLGFDPATGSITEWLSFTDRVVALRRTDVQLVETDQGIYATGIPLGPLDILRGWARVSVEHRGATYHFVTTHLETQATPPIQAAQAAELRGSVIAGLDGVTIIAGDLNSDASAESGDPTWTPTYDELIGDGFVDVWETARHRRRDEGLTCCHDRSLMGDSEFTQRIDFVLVRAAADDHGIWELRRRLFAADIVGEEPQDRTASGLWPSDHAGLAARFRVPFRLR